jgi:hypothetical protein
VTAGLEKRVEAAAIAKGRLFAARHDAGIVERPVAETHTRGSLE